MNLKPSTTRIRHTVAFNFKDPVNSHRIQKFFTEAKGLSAIPGVENFECLRQVSEKNSFTFGLSMEFEDQKAYQQYNNHPLHETFVKQYWINDVSEFLEIDYQLL